MSDREQRSGSSVRSQKSQRSRREDSEVSSEQHDVELQQSTIAPIAATIASSSPPKFTNDDFSRTITPGITSDGSIYSNDSTPFQDLSALESQYATPSGKFLLRGFISGSSGRHESSKSLSRIKEERDQVARTSSLVQETLVSPVAKPISAESIVGDNVPMKVPDGGELGAPDPILRQPSYQGQYDLILEQLKDAPNIDLLSGSPVPPKLNNSMTKNIWKTTKVAPEKPVTMLSGRYDEWNGKGFAKQAAGSPNDKPASLTRKNSGNNLLLNKVIPTNIVKLFDKPSKDKPKEKPTREEQLRQAKVAELVEQEALVLNADQLAMIQKKNTHPFTISMNSSRRFVWDFIISMSTIYVILVIPVKVGFSVSSTGASYIMDVLMDAIYLLDIVLNFFTSYIDETTGEEVKILHKIRKNYIYGWLLMDAISSFPASLVGTTSSLLSMMKVLKGARILKLQDIGLFKAATGAINHSMNPSVLRMLKLTVIFLLSQHFIACSYYYVSNAQELETSWSPTMYLIKDASLQEQYIDAFYFAIMVTTANDVNPTNETEKIVTSVMLILGILINASIIGSAANLLSNLDKAEIARKNQLDSINDYLRFKKVPLQLQDKIQRYYEYVLSSRIVDPTEDLFADMPDRLKLSLKLNLHNEFIMKVPLFQVCSTEGVIAIVQCMKNVVTMPGDLILVSGEMAQEFYFIKTGTVSIFVRLGMEEEPLGVLGEGSFFGETSLLTNEPCSTYIRSESITELAYLTKEDFISITQKFPTFHLAVRRISDSREQTASNVQKMAKMNRGRTGSVTGSNQKKMYGLRTTTRLAVWLKNARSAIDDQNTSGDLGSDGHSDAGRKTPGGRLARRKSNQLGAIDSKYLDSLSLCQARHLANIRAIENVKTKDLEEDFKPSS